jgi:hypothetical protein
MRALMGACGCIDMLIDFTEVCAWALTSGTPKRVMPAVNIAKRGKSRKEKELNRMGTSNKMKLWKHRARGGKL